MGSFSVDLSGFMTMAASMFNAFVPILLIGAAISAGVGLAFMVGDKLGRVFSGGRK